MGCKCYVPNCKSACQSQVKDTKATFHRFLEKWENKIHRGEKSLITTEPFICSEHSKESDFVDHTNGTNDCRKGKLQKGKLKYRYVKKGLYPTKFPNKEDLL